MGALYYIWGNVYYSEDISDAASPSANWDVYLDHHNNAYVDVNVYHDQHDSFPGFDLMLRQQIPSPNAAIRH